MTTALERAQRMAELAQERVGLMERLGVIEKEWGDLLADGPILSPLLPAPPTSLIPQTTENKPRRGRPPRSKEGMTEGITVVSGGNAKLPDLLRQIALEAKEPLKLTDFVAKMREFEANGVYKSEAKDFKNMVYQCLLKQVKSGVLQKDEEGKYYPASKAA